MFRCGCVGMLCVGAIVLLWAFFPSFQTRDTSRFELWPLATQMGASTRDPVGLYKSASFEFPIHAIPQWVSLAKLTRADIDELVVLRFSRSHALVLKLRIPAPQVVDRVIASGLPSTTIDGYTLATIENPSGKPGSEIWQWVAPRNDTLIIGGASAVQELLAVAAGKRPGLTSRRVLRPILEDLRNAESFTLRLIPEEGEGTMQIAQVIMRVFSWIPGAGAVLDVRGTGMGLQARPGGCVVKLDFQYNNRASAATIASVFWLFSLAGPSTWTDDPKQYPDDVFIEQEAGLVAIQFFFGESRCAAAKREINPDEIVPFFPTRADEPPKTPAKKRRAGKKRQ